MEFTLSLTVVASLVAYFVWRERRRVRSLVCLKCGRRLAGAYRRARKLESEVSQAKVAAVQERGWHVNWAPPRPLRFPCGSCGTVHVECPPGIELSPDQDFNWPDPQLEARTVVDSLEAAIDGAGEPDA